MAAIGTTQKFSLVQQLGQYKRPADRTDAMPGFDPFAEQGAG